MRTWLFMVELFGGDKVATATLLIVLALTVLSAVVGIAAKSAGLHASVCLLLSSGIGVFFLLRGTEWETLGLMLAVLGFATGSGYAAVYILLECRKKIARRKELRAEMKRRLQFTLPDRENGYLRDRLRTALRAETELFDGDKRSIPPRIEYVRKMLAKVKAAPLTPVERIDVEEMSGLLALYEKKERWSASDIKATSELFSRLLKLSAKYEIAV